MGVLIFIIILVIICSASKGPSFGNSKKDDEFDHEIDELIMYDEIFDDDEDFK